MRGFVVGWNSVVSSGLVAATALIGSQLVSSPAQSQTSRPGAAAPSDSLPEVRVRAPQQRRATRARPARRAPTETAVQTQTPSPNASQGGERGTGPVTGYVATQSVTATKTDTPILETPQSISVVTRDQMEAQQTQDVTEALRYTPGVSLDLYSATTFFDAVKVRGFDAPRYLDGLRLPLDPGTQFAFPRVEPYGLERLEVLRGPSSGLYGQTEPGGLINMISKRPLWFPHYEVEGTIGSFSRFQGAFDVGGPIDKNREFLYRVVGLGRISDSLQDFVTNNKLFIAPSFTWAPSANTTFTILGHYANQDNDGIQQYVPGEVAGLRPNPFGRVPYSRYIGEPSADRYKLEQGAIGYAFEHRFNNVFQVRQNFRYTDVTNDFAAHRSEGIFPDLRTVARSFNYVWSAAQNAALDNQLQADFATGPFAHKVLAGVDYIHSDNRSEYRSGLLAPIDAFAPVYGAVVPAADTLAPFIKTTNTQDQVGVYLQDQIKIDRFTLSLTGRHDWADAENVSTGVYPFTGTKLQKDRATTGRVGINYLFDFGLSPYASYTTSFQPIVGVDLSGNVFKPTTGEGKEIGVKFKPNGMNLLLTAAVFEITQQNVLTMDPTNPFFSVQTGEAKVRGFEFEARGNVTRQLEIVGGYSNLDPKITKANDGNVGNFMPQVALQQASLWAKYTWYDGPLAGLGLGAGVRYVGESYGDAANTLRIPTYTLFDAAISYDFRYLRPDLKGWSAQVNVTNIGDHYYVASCATALAYCSLGASRRVLGTLRYAWSAK
jgi:iron complex outermembrane recepter protein